MPRFYTGKNVLWSAVERIKSIYLEGHEVVISFSGGKDSGICVELAIIAARELGKLPVKVSMRDEEIMFPGTFEYAERVANRPEVEFHWVYAGQPITNYFNRELPLWWVFDDRVKPENWVRKPPPFAYKIPENSIEYVVHTNRFPVTGDQKLINIIGIRAHESRKRIFAMSSMGGKTYTKTPMSPNTYLSYPIYDWSNGDVWRAYKEFGWDYNKAYDMMFKMGLTKKKMRIGPPTLNENSLSLLTFASKAWPHWFDRVEARLPGLRTVAQFGTRVLKPHKKLGEKWKDVFYRTCLDNSPDWIIERARGQMEITLRRHAIHSTSEFPDVSDCHICALISSWKRLAEVMYSGDPFSFYCEHPCMEPEDFRPGAGKWGGRPSF